MDAIECLRRKAQSRIFIRFYCDLFRQQVALGHRAVFEHPTGADTWRYPEMLSLCRKYHTVKLHMCAYGLQLPKSIQFIRKSIRLLVTHEDMKSLGRLCPGSSDLNHECHDVIAGHHPTVGPVSVYAGKYPPKFVQAVLNLVPRFHSSEILLCECEDLPENLIPIDAVDHLRDSSVSKP